MPYAPAHLAIIPDGNRRWSKENRLNLLNGYNSGIKKFIDVSVWAKGFGVKMISLWALSTDNMRSRSRAELSTLYNLFIRATKDPAILSMLKENDARVRIVGNTRILPKRLRTALKGLERRTSRYKSFFINILVGYGGRDDIVYAVNRASRKGGRITYEDIRNSLQSATLPDVDMIIRTSGEMRLSGLLPWQGAYSELYFSRKYWPSFNKSDLRKAIASFSGRERRFGK